MRKLIRLLPCLLLCSLICFTALTSFASSNNSNQVAFEGFGSGTSVGSYKHERYNYNTATTVQNGLNSYLKVSPKGEGAIQVSDYTAFYMTETVNFTDKEADYIVLDFDLGSESSYIDGSRIYLASREPKPGGEGDQASSAGRLKIELTDEGNYILSDPSGAQAADLGTDPMVWHHVTVILDVNYDDLSKSTAYYYLDGAFCSSMVTNYLASTSTTLNAVRLEFVNTALANTTQSTCYDSFSISLAYDEEEPGEGSLESLLKDPTLPLNSWNGAIWSPEYKVPDVKSVASVDGVAFENESDAVAALKDGSVMELYKSFNELHKISTASTIVTSGLEFPFYSENYMASVKNGVISFGEGEGRVIWHLDDDTTVEEIYTCSFIPSYKGEVGPTIFKIANGDGTYSFHEFNGWSRRKGGTADELSSVTATDVHYYKSTSPSDGVFFASVADGYTKHYTEAELQDLINRGGATVLLGKDLKISAGLTCEAEAVIDLGGHTLYTEDGITLLTVRDNAKLTVRNGIIRKTSSSRAAMSVSGGSATFSSVKIDSSSVLSTATGGILTFEDSEIKVLLGSVQGNVIVIQGTNTQGADNATLVIKNSTVEHTAANVSNAIVDSRKCAIVRVEGSTLSSDKNIFRAATTSTVTVQSSSLSAGAIIYEASTAVSFSLGVKLNRPAEGAKLPEGADFARITDTEYSYTVSDSFASITFKAGDASVTELWVKGTIPSCYDDEVLNALGELISTDPSKKYSFDIEVVKTDKVYTPILVPIIEILYNLTLSESISINLYVPIVESDYTVTDIILDGVVYKPELLTVRVIDGVRFYFISLSGIAPHAAAKVNELTIKAVIGSDNYDFPYSVSAVKYCERVLAEGNLTHGNGAEELATSIIKYVHSAYVYGNKTDADEYASLSELALSMKDFTVEIDEGTSDRNYSNAVGRIYSAAFALSDKPTLILRFQKGFSGRIVISYTAADNGKVKRTYNLTEGKLGGEATLSLELPVYALSQGIDIEMANGTPVLNYDLASYYRGVGGIDEDLDALIRALYSYSYYAWSYSTMQGA